MVSCALRTSAARSSARLQDLGGGTEEEQLFSRAPSNRTPPPAGLDRCSASTRPMTVSVRGTLNGHPATRSPAIAPPPDGPSHMGCPVICPVTGGYPLQR